MMPKDVPEGPWQNLSADVITDTFSKYPFLYKISSKAAEPVTQRIKSLISQYGPTKTLSTDNGPPISLEAFAQFMQKEHIDHITSSPDYPKSNNFIERQIKTIKTALSSCQEAKLPIADLLLNIRTQAIGSHLPSLREILSIEWKNAQVDHHIQLTRENICNFLISKKATQKENHDKSHKVRTLQDIISMLGSSFPKSSGPPPIYRRHHNCTCFNSKRLHH